MSMPAPPTGKRIWDSFVRLFHWGLVACVTVAAVTGFLMGPAWVPVHLWSGGLAAALVLARIEWGLWGPTHARFASFLRGPAEVGAHLRALASGTHGRRYVGHNPLGALMVVTVLAAVLALAATGLVIWGGVLKGGPLAFATSFATGWAVRGVHKAIAIAVLVLIAAHLGGVALESRREDESLVAAMIHGRKAARPGDVAVRERPARLRLALAAGATVSVLGLAAGIGLSALPAPNLPVAPAHYLPAYADECSACHAAFNPSLLPAASWVALMQRLSDHFGEDASLDAPTTKAISDWLSSHAAGTADTLPAHFLARVNPDHPFRITAMRFWIRMHRRIPLATFATKAVHSRANCGACHADAQTGLFRPSSISVPEEAEQ